MFNRTFASRGSAKKPDRLWSKCGQHWLLNGSQSVYDVGFEYNFSLSRSVASAADRVAREHIEKVVATDSCELTYINGLAKALALLQRKQFKIIVLDLNLPDSKGASTFDAVKESSGDTPIIIFAAREGVELKL